ncbi:MAG: zinc ribbon domain-containing protein [bacterium]|nr:zinc ribbon domain-containing protein [bacterium]
MQCSKCGKIVTAGAAFCPQCGTAVDQAGLSSGNQLLYKLTENAGRNYTITVNRENVLFAGDFWYLKDKEFVKSHGRNESALVKNFIGIGYLAKRSFRKCLLFVIAGSALEVVKMIVDKLTEWVDKANNYLKWIDQSISLPGWMNVTVNALAILCILFGIALFFSKKKVIEISFTDKRICVPQKSMTGGEYNMLYQSIMKAKNMI